MNLKGMLPLLLAAAAIEKMPVDHNGIYRGGKRVTYKGDNPHKFPRFETDGFVTYSINQASHDAKYAKYLKKKV